MIQLQRHREAYRLMYVVCILIARYEYASIIMEINQGSALSQERTADLKDDVT